MVGQVASTTWPPPECSRRTVAALLLPWADIRQYQI